MAAWLKAAENFLDGVDDTEGTRTEHAPSGRGEYQRQKKYISHDSLHRGSSGKESEGGATKGLVHSGGLQDNLQNRKAKSRNAALTGGFSHSTPEMRSQAYMAPKSQPSGHDSREPQLQKMCDELRKDLDNAQTENSRLEGVVRSVKLKAKESAGHVEALRMEMEKADTSSSRREATLQAEAVAKDLEIKKISGDLASTKKWAAELEAQIVALQGTNQKLLDDKETNEGLVSEALRRELTEVERQLGQERTERIEATKSASLREENVQQELSESASALARMQRQLDERNSRVLELDQEVSALKEQLQKAPAHVQIMANEKSARSEHVHQMEILQEEVAAARMEAEELRTYAASADSNIEELKTEIEAIKKQSLEDSSQVSSSQLEHRLREVTDLLYEKQQQCEKLVANKNSQYLGMEHKLHMLQEELNAANRRNRSESMSQANALGLDTVIPMDALGETFYNLAHHKRLGRAVRTGAQFLDNTASKVVFLLRQYPLWRLGVFVYFCFIHLYCYLLISRLQRRVVIDAEHALPGNAHA